jgi:hypothetical protein
MGLTLSLNTTGQISDSENINLDSPAFYSAKDSIVADVPNQIIRLYGQAVVTFEDVVLNAEIIEFDMKNNEVTARYGLDSLGNPTGKPVFNQGGEEIICESIKYNFDTKKGYITELRTQQGEGYIHMAESKIQPNQEIHLKNGKYTSCDAEKPHYHFQLSKAMVIPDKRIVTGPLYMRILNVPLPIAAPFAFLPNSETRKHGIVIPEIALASPFGTGLKDLGYYIPVNENIETYFYASGYTTGRWGISNQTNYYKRYKSRGNFTLKYEHLKGFFYEDATSNNYTVRWKHSQDPKAHPSIKFNSDINFISNNPQSSLEIIPENYFNTQLNSSMNLTKNWKLNQFNGSWTVKTSLRQNKSSETNNIDLPSFNLNVSRFNLGVLRKVKIGKKWYENIGITYSLNSANTINAPDNIFNFTDYSEIGEYAINGIKQNAVIQTNLKPKSGWFNFNLTTNYSELWNFQSFAKDWNIISQEIDTTFVNGLRATRNVNFSGGASSNLYGYYKSNQLNVKARHVMSPKISFTYKPDLGAHQFYLDSLAQEIYYSPFDVSLYKEVSRGESGLISFSLGNTLELKTRNRKDSLNETYKSKRLVDAFNIGGSYDIFKDSLQLSDLTFSFRTTPIKSIGLQAGWRLNPYEWDDITGEKLNTYAWNAGKGIGRVTSANTAISARFKSKTKVQTDTTVKMLRLPWTLNVAYNINYSRNQNGIVQQDTFKLTQTLRASGKVSINEKWRFDYLIDYDIQSFNSISPTEGLSRLKFGIWRDLHCWEAALNWEQIGAGKFYTDAITNSFTWTRPNNYALSLRVNIKASMFNAFLPQQNLRIPQGLW